MLFKPFRNDQVLDVLAGPAHVAQPQPIVPDESPTSAVRIALVLAAWPGHAFALTVALNPILLVSAAPQTAAWRATVGWSARVRVSRDSLVELPTDP